VVVHDRHLLKRLAKDEMVKYYEASLMFYENSFRKMVGRLDADFGGSQRRATIFPDPGFKRLADKVLKGSMSNEEARKTMDVIENEI